MLLSNTQLSKNMSSQIIKNSQKNNKHDIFKYAISIICHHMSS